MKIREIAYIVIISAFSIISLLSYNTAQNSQRLLRDELAKIENENQKVWAAYKEQQEEYSKELEKWRRNNEQCKTVARQP